MFPIRDENPSEGTPWVLMALIVLNVLSWAFIENWGSPIALADALCHYGLIPADLLGRTTEDPTVNLGGGLECSVPEGNRAFTLVSHMFLHGGWFHLIGNLWFLWIFGDNVEDVTGHARFLIFYLLAGLAAAGTQILSGPDVVTPMVGASGAIGGVMGAYARLFPAARIETLIIIGFYVTTIRVPALVMLGLWFLMQLLSSFPALQDAGTGIAFFAHVGGFATGFFLITPMARSERLPSSRLPR